MPYLPPCRPSNDALDACREPASQNDTHKAPVTVHRPSSPPRQPRRRRRRNSYPYPFQIEGRPRAAEESLDDPNGDRQVVHKQSGEVVSSVLRPPRRPAARSLSGPPTPKAVHFDTHVDVRRFLFLDRPAAVSSACPTAAAVADDPPDDAPWRRSPQPLILDALTPLRPIEASSILPGPPVYLERLRLAADGTSLLGWAAVANLAYEKQVHCRFTLDDWRTTNEVAANYHSSIPGTDKDRFTFSATLLASTNSLERATLILCLQYRVKGLEFWDNNNGVNYRFRFLRVAAEVPDSAPSAEAIERGRQPASSSTPSSSLPDSRPVAPLISNQPSDSISKRGRVPSEAMSSTRQRAATILLRYPQAEIRSSARRPSLSERYDLDAQLDTSRSAAGIGFSNLAIRT